MKEKSINSYAYLFLLTIAFACTKENVAQPDYHALHASIIESAIKDRRFTHSTIEALIQKLPEHLFEVEEAGQSIEGRSIYQVKLGNGPIKILLWSQMHGNEPTATMALFDLFNYFQSELSRPDHDLLDKLTFYFVPMLNPDGAERFARRNALPVDLNRDALRLQNPESRILMALRDQIEPEWGFNLHDQNRYTSAGKTANPASMSFLAPAYNEEKEWNTPRTEAMQVIVEMRKILSTYLPDQIGRYSDEFEPRAFGDNIQSKGTRTILIETGGRRADLEKQYLRKMNFIALLSAFRSIADRTYRQHTQIQYEDIPFNSNRLHELIVRGVNLAISSTPYVIDLAFRHFEIELEEGYYTRGSISDIGDIHNYYGYEEFDAQGMQLVYGEVDDEVLTIDQVVQIQPEDYLKKGITYLRLDRRPTMEDRRRTALHLLGPGQEVPNYLDLGDSPGLLLKKEGAIQAAVVNGKLHLL